MNLTLLKVAAKPFYNRGSGTPDTECIEEVEQVEGMLMEGFVKIRRLLVRGPSCPSGTGLVRKVVLMAAV